MIPQKDVFMIKTENNQYTPAHYESSASYKIQLIRGLAIAAIVLAHNSPGGLTAAFLRPFFNPSVGLFLCISGMLSSADRWNPKKRITKIIIPYILWTLIYTVFENRESVSMFLITFLKSLVTGNGAAVMYYVFVYCALTLLVPLIDRAARSEYRYWWLLLSPAEILLFHTIPIVMDISFDEIFRRIIYLSFVPWFSYYYLGYLIGHGFLTVRTGTKKLLAVLSVSIMIQILEGCWYYSFGYMDCGTEYKVSTFLTNMIVAILSCRFIYSDRTVKCDLLKYLGDNSFGIFFSHLAVMLVLKKIPYYKCVPFPFDAIITMAATLCGIQVGKKILGKYSKYLAL